MTIQKSTWNRYIDVLAAIDRTAAKKFTAYLNTHDISSQAGRKAAIDYAAALADKYGESAAAMACEMYDAAAAASGVILPAAEPAATATYGEVAKTVNGMAKQNAGNDAMGSAIGRMVKRTGVDTTMKNAIRDGAQWAWIPSGDSCAFCLTLASRGWQRASKKALKNGHAEHIHSNCDCTYAVRFDSRSTVAGYDPDALYKQYQSAEGNTPQEKINSMRRELYAENGDKIRAQKREAYERTKLLKDNRDNGILRAAEQSRRNPGPDQSAVISDLISSEAYAEKMHLLGENDRITNIMTQQARITLYRRNGTTYEDLIFIDPKNGKVLSQRTENIAGGVRPTEEMKTMVLQNKRGIIALHNHPHSMLPSKNDLENAKRYRYGVIACHNGNLIKYAVADDANIDVADVMLDTIQKHFDAGMDVAMSLKLLEEIGIKMEVI